MLRGGGEEGRVEVVPVGSSESTQERRIVLYKSNHQKQLCGEHPF